jgi:hypothetical protein
MWHRTPRDDDQRRRRGDRAAVGPPANSPRSEALIYLGKSVVRILAGQPGVLSGATHSGFDRGASCPLHPAFERGRPINHDISKCRCTKGPRGHPRIRGGRSNTAPPKPKSLAGVRQSVLTNPFNGDTACSS